MTMQGAESRSELDSVAHGTGIDGKQQWAIVSRTEIDSVAATDCLEVDHGGMKDSNNDEACTRFLDNVDGR